MSLSLTHRDRDLLETLTRRVSLLAVGQAARLCWPQATSRGRARRRLKQLAQAGWIDLRVVTVHPLLPVGQPLCQWRPGKNDPDCDRISRAARSRWSQAARPLEICVASPRTAGLFGSTAVGLPKREHLDHDLRLASVYVHYRTRHPRLARLWIGEHALPKAGYRIKDPDAFLRERDGTLRRVIESAGRYSAAQVESFHEHCCEQELSYELW